MLTQLKIALIALTLVWSAGQGFAAELVMVEMGACTYCQKFRSEVEPTYSGTEAGRVAPLRKVSAYKKWPADLAGVQQARFTPVFIVVDNGQEVGRFAGFTTAPAFYSKLKPLLARLH